MKLFSFSVAILLIPNYAVAAASFNFNPCAQYPGQQAKRSRELQTLYATDQSDRKFMEENPGRPWPPKKVEQMARHDLQRRKKVAEIFAEGCLNSAADYKAAAMIYQHGTQPDHYFQTYIWSKRGVDLGDASQNDMMALGLDRYLVNTNHKQLFASQAIRMGTSECWCLQPVEKSFTDNLRTQYTRKSMADRIEWLKSMNVGHSCPDVECKMDLVATPKGSVPGIW